MPEKIIDVTPVQVGHVLGKGGATIKAVQERTGAKVEILHEGPRVKITADDDSKLEAAVAEVQAIVENQEHPDYEGAVGSRLRAEANALGDKRAKLFDEATRKREAGDHAAANALVAEAKEVGEAMQARHREAAAAIAKFNNEDKGKGEDFFDMHGLREEEAMELLRERVGRLEAKPAGTVTDFEVVPGAGHHSAPGAQKLKGTTEAFLKEKGYAYEAVNAGTFMVKVPGTGEAVVSAPEEGDRKKPKVEKKPQAVKESPHAEEKPKAEEKPVAPISGEKRKSEPKERKPEENAKDKKKKQKSKSCCACM